jgi:hypothetical protein
MTLNVNAIQRNYKKNYTQYDKLHNNTIAHCYLIEIFMLSVIKLSVIMLSVVRLSVIMLSVVRLSVIMLSVVAPMQMLSPCWRGKINKRNLLGFVNKL